MKMSPGRAFPLLEVKPGQTLRQFLALLLNIISALTKLGCPPAPEMQKFIYLESAYLIYGEFNPETEGWVYDRYIDLPLAASGFEELLKKERIDPSFSQTYSVTS